MARKGKQVRQAGADADPAVSPAAPGSDDQRAATRFTLLLRAGKLVSAAGAVQEVAPKVEAKFTGRR